MKHVFVRDLGLGSLLEELLVLVASHLSLISVPNGSQVVENLAIQLDGI